jgi:hypothetical protein
MRTIWPEAGSTTVAALLALDQGQTVLQDEHQLAFLRQLLGAHPMFDLEFLLVLPHLL